MSHNFFRGRRPSDMAGFTMIELLIIVGIVSILALVATPILLGSREKAWRASCDDLYVSISSELENEMDTFRNEGLPDAAEEALDLVIPRHEGIDFNPRDLDQGAFVDQGSCAPFVPPQSSQCQVFFCFDGEDTVVTQQFSVASRSYRITVQ